MPRRNKRIKPEQEQERRDQRKIRRTRDGRKILGEVSWTETHVLGEREPRFTEVRFS